MTTVPPPAAEAAAMARLIASLSIVTPSPLAPKSRTSKLRRAGLRVALCADDTAGVVALPARLAAPAQAAAKTADAREMENRRGSGMCAISRGGTPRAAAG